MNKSIILIEQTFIIMYQFLIRLIVIYRNTFRTKKKSEIVNMYSVKPLKKISVFLSLFAQDVETSSEMIYQRINKSKISIII